MRNKVLAMGFLLLFSRFLQMIISVKITPRKTLHSSLVSSSYDN